VEGLINQESDLMLIISHADVEALLAGQERPVVDLVRDAYRRHDLGDTSVPHSCFLRFPQSPRDRIIALPAYLGGDEPVAGVKWVSSFPANITVGVPRASAAMLLNSIATGRPEALVEASMINSWRTAASAAAAAALLTERPVRSAALVGCGVINFEVLRFLLVTLPDLSRVSVFDADRERAEAFVRRCGDFSPRLTVAVAPDRAAALAGAEVVSLATTAATPYMGLDECDPAATVLHVSLRDLTPEAILASRNVVDDAHHVCREQTSLHLTEQVTGDRRFIHASIGALLRGAATLPKQPGRVVFSPFGLGVLDLAVARFVRDRAIATGRGVRVPDFLEPATGPAVPAGSTISSDGRST
jgi:2,3-diaminopropionate biosynthesis protein SbnB